MKKTCKNAEVKRVLLQADLDSAKTAVERNKLGQFATPPELADGVLGLAKSLMPPREKVRFLDPAFGTGSFYSALLGAFSPDEIEWARGIELDTHYAGPAMELWRDFPLKLQRADFTATTPPDLDDMKPNLIVCNPPYVRHHHIATAAKTRLQETATLASGTSINGLSGLYCYFMCLSHAWMAEDGVGIWLVPSEFMDVNYGKAIKDYLLNRITLVRIHRFDPADVQFDDAMVSSAVVCLRNTPPNAGHQIGFTYGGTLEHPRVSRMIPAELLASDSKWTGLATSESDPGPAREQPRLSDFFSIQRGVATGANAFFLISEEDASTLELPKQFLRPILPSPRYLQTDEIPADKSGNPLIKDRRYLLNCDLHEDEIQDRFPRLWDYIQKGKANGIDKRYLSAHRTPWYSQEKREPPIFLCTYMGRKRPGEAPFRFILNHSDAIAANVYLLLYPKPIVAKGLATNKNLAHAVWQALKGIRAEDLIGAGRVYGGGLHKVEPRELANAPAAEIARLFPEIRTGRQQQMKLHWTA